MSADLRIAVIGVGAMGANHVERIATRIHGARVGVICDAATEHAHTVAATVPGARVIDDPLDAIADGDVDAVLLATPGPTHEHQLRACLDHGKPVLCEKPLTTDPVSAHGIVRRERESGQRLIQVGFMRRFDREYRELKRLIDAGALGSPLMVHCVHRNASAPAHFASTTVIEDSLVHEVDVARFLLGEEIRAVTIVRPTPSTRVRSGLQDPQFAVFETQSGRIVDVEVFVSTGVGYEVRTEVVGELGTAMIGLDAGMIRTSAPGHRFGTITPGYLERFGQAYDTEVQGWVNAVGLGADTGNYIAGPTSWDGYAAAAVCSAAVHSLRTGVRVEVHMDDPDATTH